MLRRVIITLAVLALLLQTVVGRPETVKKSLDIGQSPLLHGDQNDRFDNTNLDLHDSQTSDKLSIIQRVLINLVDAFKNCIERSAREYHDNHQRKMPSVSTDISNKRPYTKVRARHEDIQFNAKKSNREEQSLPESSNKKSFSVVNKNSFNNEIARFRIKDSPAGDVCKNCNYDNTVGADQENQEFKEQKLTNGHWKRPRRSSPNEKSKLKIEYLPTDLRDADAILKLLFRQDANRAENNANNKEVFVRTTRDRLNRMPITFGKREEDEDEYPEEEMAQFLVSERDRFSRKPVKFGTRNPTEQNNQSFLAILEDIIHGHSEEFKHIPNNGDISNEIATLFTRIPKGSLHRMPITFGKRQNGVSGMLADDESNPDKNSKHRIPLKEDKIHERNNFFQFFHIKRSDISPILLKNTDSRYDNSEIPFQFHHPVNELITRSQRSKLERMPLAFGKRHHALTVIKHDSGSFHKIKQRSRLERMPVSFGKRSFRDLSLEGKYLIGQLISAGTSDAQESEESRMPKSLLALSKTSKDSIQQNV